MTRSKEYILVSAPNKVGEEFLKNLIRLNIPVAAITNNEEERVGLEVLGINEIITVNTTDDQQWVIPEVTVGKVFLFERSFTLCCRYIQICRPWTQKPVYVITQGQPTRLIYKGLGADYVIHTSSNDVSFLIRDHF